MCESTEPLIDPFSEKPIISPTKIAIPDSTKIRKRTVSLRTDEESIVSLAICKMQKLTLQNNNVLLCAGTSKGTIVVWSLLFENNKSTNTSDKVRFEKLHEFKEAHGKHEVDDLQVISFPNNSLNKGENSERFNLLSIGRDNKCIIWSLKTFQKLTDINYLPTLNNDSNLRMKHARFSTNSNFFYATFIPRTRGGNKDMSSYIERWSFDSTNDSTFQYKLESKHRIRNTIITTIQCSKDGDYVCVGDYEGRVDLFDLNFNKVINFKKQHSSVITDLIFYHDFINTNNTADGDDNKLILTISIDRTLQCYKFINDRTKVVTKNSSIISRLDPLICSINTFKIILILFLSVFLFCYYFTFLE